MFSNWLDSTGNSLLAYDELLNDVENLSNEVIITTYEHCRINIRSIRKLEWSYVVLDEGHKLSTYS